MNLKKRSGVRLRRLRETYKSLSAGNEWTQDWVAEKLDIASNTYSKYEQGTVWPRRDSHFDDLCKLFKVDGNFFMVPDDIFEEMMKSVSGYGQKIVEPPQKPIEKEIEKPQPQYSPNKTQMDLLQIIAARDLEIADLKKELENMSQYSAKTEEERALILGYRASSEFPLAQQSALFYLTGKRPEKTGSHAHQESLKVAVKEGLMDLVAQARTKRGPE